MVTRSTFGIVFLLVVLLGAGAYYHFFYQGTQLFLKLAYAEVENPPAEYFFDHSDSNCGIWYDGPDRQGSKNTDVNNCLQKSFDDCNSSVSLFVKEHDDGSTIFAGIRMLGTNPEGACVIQNNYYHEISPNNVEQWKMTCIYFGSEMINTCRPEAYK